MATENLLNLLETQRGVFRRLLELVRQERTCLLHSQLDSLDAIIDEQSALLSQQRINASHITRELERLAVRLHIEGHVTLARVAEKIPAAYGTTLTDLYRELHSLAAEVQHEGRVTWQLAQQALSYIDFTMKLIGKAKSGPTTYAPSMKAPSRTAMQLLVDSCG